MSDFAVVGVTRSSTRIDKYLDYLSAKTQCGANSGFEPVWMPDFLFDFQLDVIDRCVELFSNPGETVFTPFMGVGSEVYSPVMLGRRGIGAELKPSYYRQAIKNVMMAAEGKRDREENGELDLDIAREAS